MDDLLTKPLDVRRLQAVLDRLGLRTDRGSRLDATEVAHAVPAEADDTLDEADVVKIVASSAAEPPLDAAAFAEMTGGEAEFERELAHTFLLTSENLVAELSRAVGRGDRDALSRAAHSLKGASANIHARPLRTLCAELESSAAVAPDVELMRHIARIAMERQRVVVALHRDSQDPRAAGSA